MEKIDREETLAALKRMLDSREKRKCTGKTVLVEIGMIKMCMEVVKKIPAAE